MEIKADIKVNELDPIRQEKPNWSDEGKELPVYKIKLSELHYNEENGRIATWISTYYSENENTKKLSSLSREEYNNIVEKFVRRANKSESMNNLVNDIKKKTQLNPGVVLTDGTIVSGNRRFTALRELYDLDCDDKYGYFECFVLPYPTNNSQNEFIKLIETKTQFSVVTEEDYNPIDRLVTIYKYLIDSKTKIWSIKEYAKKIGIKQSEAENLYERASIMIDYLEFIGQPKAFHIARERKLDGSIAELASMHKKMKDTRKDEWNRITPVFYSEMNKTQGDRTREVRKLKKIYEKDINEFNRLLDSFYKKQDEIEKKLEQKSIIFTDTKIAEDNREIPLVSVDSIDIEKASKKIEKIAAREKQITNAQKALDDLEKIEIDVLSHMNDEEISKLDSVLDKLSRKIISLKDRIGK